MQIAALTSYLRQSGIEVSYSEYYIFTDESFEKHQEQVREDLLKEQPDIVAFSTYDMNYQYTLDCARFANKINAVVIHKLEGNNWCGMSTGNGFDIWVEVLDKASTV